jgi:hypothetical protein
MDNDEQVATKQAVKKRRRNRNSRIGPPARKARIATSVQNRFVDLLFPETANTGESLTTEDKARWELQRKSAVQKIQNWRKCGKPWSMLIKRFGQGILLMLPKDISDETSVSYPASPAMFQHL